MNYRNRISLVLILTVFFMIVWITQSYYLLSNKSFESLIYLNNSASGYNSIVSYSIFYIIPFLIYYSLSNSRNKVVCLIRHKNRIEILLRQNLDILISSLSFVTILSTINIIMSLFFYPKHLVLSADFITISLINGCSAAIFFCIAGNVYLGFRMFINNSGFSIANTFLTFSIMFFFYKLLVGNKFWTFFSDISLYSRYFYEELSIIQLIFSIIRLFCFLIIIIIVNISFFVKRDVL